MFMPSVVEMRHLHDSGTWVFMLYLPSSISLCFLLMSSWKRLSWGYAHISYELISFLLLFHMTFFRKLFLDAHANCFFSTNLKNIISQFKCTKAESGACDDNHINKWSLVMSLPSLSDINRTSTEGFSVCFSFRLQFSPQLSGQLLSGINSGCTCL